MKLSLVLLASVFFVPALSACDTEDDNVQPQAQTVVDLAQSSSDLSTLVTALSEAGLVDDLQGPGPFTVFAPVNSAFAALGSDTIERLLADGNSDLLTEVLTYHVVPGRVLAADLQNGQMAETLQGSEVTITLQNGNAFVDGVRIIETDLTADNGVVHLIEGVLTTPLDVTGVARLQGFGNLVAALGAADLVGALQADGPFTVFAPTDQAFSNAADALGLTLPELLALPNLGDILLYHVVSGEVLAGDLSEGQTVTTLSGATFTVRLAGGPAIDTDGDGMNDASIVATDVQASNGVIHVLDAVLLPPGD